MRVLVKHRSMSTSVGIVRNGDIVDLPEAEVKKISVTKKHALEVLPEPKAEKPAPKKKAPARKKKATSNAKSIDKDK